jgi:membrane fusion protein, heavy metal efflux system
MTTARCLCLLAALLVSCDRKPEHEEDEHAHEGKEAERTVTLLRHAAARAGIKTAKVARAHLARRLHAPAEVVLDPDRTAHLGPLSDARIEKVAVALGDHVKAGSLLAVLRSAAAGDSRAELEQASADAELAGANLVRQQALQDAGIGAVRSFEQARADARRAQAAVGAARSRLQLVGGYELRSPIAGTVIERHATLGEAVGPGDALFTVSDLSQVWIVGQVYERDVGAIAPRARASLRLEAYPERSWSGELSYVAGALQHETRTLPVRMELDNAEGVLRPGLFGALEIEAGNAAQAGEQNTFDAIAVPSGAVQRMGSETLVFVTQPGDAEHVRFVARAVELGRSAGDQLEVASGLRDGEEIAVSGTFTLRGELLRGSLAGHEH